MSIASKSKLSRRDLWANWLSQLMYRELTAFGGFTSDEFGQFDVVASGFVYSPDNSNERSFDLIGADDIRDYLLANRLPSGNRFYGGWLDAQSGRFYLDVVEQSDCLQHAWQRAQDANQLAIYDVENGRSIYLPKRQNGYSGLQNWSTGVLSPWHWVIQGDGEFLQHPDGRQTERIPRTDNEARNLLVAHLLSGRLAS